MEKLDFIRQNQGWNAEPNAPDARVRGDKSFVELSFVLNHQAYDAQEEEIGFLTFDDVSAWRLGPTNDEGWSMGQCRYSGIAPNWGEFYEISGDDPSAWLPNDWRHNPPFGTGNRHFLFYLRDNTFECFAREWSLRRQMPPPVVW
jgi:hypothetical protein